MDELVVFFFVLSFTLGSSGVWRVGQRLGEAVEGVEVGSGDLLQGVHSVDRGQGFDNNRGGVQVLELFGHDGLLAG